MWFDEIMWDACKRSQFLNLDSLFHQRLSTVCRYNLLAARDTEGHEYILYVRTYLVRSITVRLVVLKSNMKHKKVNSCLFGLLIGKHTKQLLFAYFSCLNFSMVY